MADENMRARPTGEFGASMPARFRGRSGQVAQKRTRMEGPKPQVFKPRPTQKQQTPPDVMETSGPTPQQASKGAKFTGAEIAAMAAIGTAVSGILGGILQQKSAKRQREQDLKIARERMAFEADQARQQRQLGAIQNIGAQAQAGAAGQQSALARLAALFGRA